MTQSGNDLLKSVLGEVEFKKLMAIDNGDVHAFIADTIGLCEPERVLICDDSPEDIATIRRQAVALGEEQPLNVDGHTIHFDGITDQGRDRKAVSYTHLRAHET